MRILAVLALLPLLAGCSDADWNKLLAFDGSPHPVTRTSPTTREVAAQRPVAVTAQPPAAAPPPVPTPGATQAQATAALNPLCLGVARQDAMSNDFDTATQQKVAVRAYQQCQQIFGN